MGQLRTGLRAYALEGHAPAETLKRLDRLLQTISGRGMATAAYAVIDPATGTLRYASAGHPPPVLVRGVRQAGLLGITAAPPLGALAFAAYHDVEAESRSGARGRTRDRDGARQRTVASAARRASRARPEDDGGGGRRAGRHHHGRGHRGGHAPPAGLTMTPLADIRFETLDRVVVARIEGEIDMSNAAELGTAITGRVPGDALAVVLDLGAVEYLDSAGIHTVYELRERLQRRGQEIRLVVAPDSPIATALEYAGAAEALGAADTLQDAIAGLRD
jgi:anti-anti-sigma factor